MKKDPNNQYFISARAEFHDPQGNLKYRNTVRTGFHSNANTMSELYLEFTEHSRSELRKDHPEHKFISVQQFWAQPEQLEVNGFESSE